MDIETVINNIEASDFNCTIFRRKVNGEWVWEVAIDARDSNNSGISVSSKDTSLKYALYDLFNRLSSILALQQDQSPYVPQPAPDDNIPF